MAPPKKSTNASGLGRAIINKQGKIARERHETGLYTTDMDISNQLKSVTQERDLDEFLNTATLAGTEFTAERRNVKIVTAPAVTNYNPYLLSEEEEKSTVKKQSENSQRLRVPRRPAWNRGISTVQLDRQEKDAFLEWRRGLADLQDRDKFLLTPFERNIEVWRQLWRVLERSQLIVQIVDARNPLNFRCPDLESYVMDVEGSEGEHGTGKGVRRNLLLINKADLLTAKQRRMWADYFDSQNIRYAFFSAANAAALQELRREAEAEQEASAYQQPEAEEEETESEEEETEDADAEDQNSSEGEHAEKHVYQVVEEDNPDGRDPRAKVLSVVELEELFIKTAPDLSTFVDPSGKKPSKLVVGLVGYPNVGKSSTINALIGEKKVSVSSTPGKTKHFQTINLSDDITLCDCPGLVFPQFATTKAALICDGVLPIDQMKEYTGPIALVVKQIRREVIEATYGLSIQTRGVEEGGDGLVRAADLLVTYAVARGYTRAGQGTPDEARAARYILKDYMNAKLLYCHPPPDVDSDAFNEETQASALERAQGTKKGPLTRVGKNASTFIPLDAPANPDGAESNAVQGTGRKTKILDQNFFESGTTLSPRPFISGGENDGVAVDRVKLFPHQHALANDGTPLDPRQLKMVASGQGPGKKHHKKPKKVKQRSGAGYD